MTIRKLTIEIQEDTDKGLLEITVQNPGEFTPVTLLEVARAIRRNVPKEVLDIADGKKEAPKQMRE